MAAKYEDVKRKLDYLDDTKGLIATAIEEKGQDITDQDTFRAYVEKILNIETGEIKLFNSIEEMNLDEKSENGDLAIVYNTLEYPLHSNMSFSEIEIPRTFTIDSTYIYTRQISTSNFQMAIGGFYSGQAVNNTIIIVQNTKEYYILRYRPDESGLNFVFSSGEYNGNNFEFDTESFRFNFEKAVTVGNINSVFEGLLNVVTTDFQGLYQYTLNNEYAKSIYYGKGASINELGQFVTELQDWVDMGDVENKIFTYMTTPDIEEFGGITKFNNVEGHSVKNLTMYHNFNQLIQYNGETYIEIGGPYDTLDLANEANATIVKVKFNADFENLLLENANIETQIVEITIGEQTKYYIIGDKILDTDYITNWQYRKVGGGIASINYLDPIIMNTFTSGVYYSFEHGYRDCYIQAPNQLTAYNGSHLVTGCTAYGNDGIIVGDGTYLQHTTTKEFRDYFMPQLPESFSTTQTAVIQSGTQRVPYYTFVEREYKYCDDMDGIKPEEDVVVDVETILDTTFTSNLYQTIKGCEFNKSFYTEHNNQLYYGIIGYNMSSRTSSNGSSSLVHETFLQIHGLLICLDTNSVYKSFSNTYNWKPFSGYGNDYEDPNANIACVNYDFDDDMFVFIIDTGTWAWNSSGAPFIAMGKIKGSTGALTTQRWEVGKHNAPREYVKANYMRYDITTNSLIVPLYGWDKDTANYYTHMICKISSSGSISEWVNKGANLEGYSLLGEDESFYTHEPIFYFRYTDTNGKNHCILKRIDTGKELEIIAPYSTSDNKRAIYGGYMYYTANNPETAQPSLYKVKISDMTLTCDGTLPGTLSSTTFILFNRVPHIVSNNKVYALSDLSTPIYTFYNTSSMYNDVRVDGVEIADGVMQSMYPKASIYSTEILFNKYRQHLYVYRVPETIPVKHDLYFTWPTSVGSDKVSSCYKYQSLPLKLSNYDGTITPFDYEQALLTAQQIEGR